MNSMTKKRQHHQHAVTTRFSAGDYAQILELAEERGTTVAGIVRYAWRTFIQETDFNVSLAKLENRLTSRIFEICCAVSGLSDDERQEAQHELIAKLTGVSEHE